jgi:hypothetical protein
MCIIYYPAALIPHQPSQPLPCIIYLSNTRISVLPEGEEFLVVFYGFVNKNRRIISV